MNHTHISHKFNEEMEEVRNHVLSMGGLVEQQLSQSLKALQDSNNALGQSVVKNDYKINALEVSIDEECIRILARRQPAASDLRLVITIMKTITDLERIGDEAGKIGHLAANLVRFSESIRFLHLGKAVEKMVHDALDAFARTDIDAALAVVKEDKQVDQEYEALMRQLITIMMEDPRTISYVLDIMWAARAVERIGDHAKNICEYVIYLVKGKDVRHTSIEDMEQEIYEENNIDR